MGSSKLLYFYLYRQNQSNYSTIAVGLKRTKSKGDGAGDQKKDGTKRGVKTGAGVKRASIKKVVSTALHKSPRKGVQQARRNLCFDKSPRKRVATPVKKAKTTPLKLTPGKRHRIIVPNTPVAKLIRRKSDGNRSISDTPDKHAEPYLSSTFATRSEFYSDNR